MIKELDLNEVSGCVRMQIVDIRDRQITFSLDALGRASITVEQLGVEQVTVGRRGDQSVVFRRTSEFLGRQRYQGKMEGLQGLCSYLTDNAPQQACLAEPEVLALLFPLLENKSPR